MMLKTSAKLKMQRAKLAAQVVRVVKADSTVQVVPTIHHCQQPPSNFCRVRIAVHRRSP